MLINSYPMLPEPKKDFGLNVFPKLEEKLECLLVNPLGENPPLADENLLEGILVEFDAIKLLVRLILLFTSLIPP